MNSDVILQIEDDPNDVFLFQHALKRSGISATVRVARDAREAIDYLTHSFDQAKRQEYPLPRLILLDLKLPRTSGLEVLEWIRTQPMLKVIPVIVLSSSTQPGDIRGSYLRGANSFLVKPSSSAQFVDLVKLLHAYWLIANQPSLEGED
jgi:CheY-like chemotaxis protein